MNNQIKLNELLNKGWDMLLFLIMCGGSLHTKKSRLRKKKERAGKEREGLVRYMNVCTTRQVDKQRQNKWIECSLENINYITQIDI